MAKNYTTAFFALFLLISGGQAFSQTFGIRAGLNMSSMLLQFGGEDQYPDQELKPGFHVGATASFALGNTFSVEPALLLSSKGLVDRSTGLDEWGLDVKNKTSLDLLYLDIPVLFKAAFPVGSVKIFVAAGPYAGIGLTGKLKTKLTEFGETFDEEIDVEWDDDEAELGLKRLDFGTSVAAGLEIKAVSVGLSYNQGLANLSPFGDDLDAEIKNSVFALSVGYKFMKK